MIRYLIFKNNVHVATANSQKEADDIYAHIEADEIREFEDDGWLNMLADD